MVKRTRKLPVKLEERKQWLRRNEEDGESVPQIAEKDGFDVRTVRKQIELARQEREFREVRSKHLLNALEQHHDDLRKYAERLNSEIMGFRNVPASPDDDLIASALRQHMPRSPIWAYLSKRDSLQQRTEAEKSLLVKAIEQLVRSDDRLKPLTDTGLSQVTPGVVAVLAFSADQWSHGNIGHTLRDSPALERVADGHFNFRLGFAGMGTTDDEAIANGYLKIIRNAVIDLESGVRGLQEYNDLEKTTNEIARVKAKLREELAVIRLRRIVPGRCKYCPV